MSNSTLRTILVSLLLLICVTDYRKSSVLSGIKAESHDGNGDITESSHPTPPVKGRERADGSKRIKKSQCDIFSEGEWVHDDRYPLYDSNQDCPYLRRQFDCKRNGRPDSDYRKWRWKPKDCTIPRFDASGLLEFLSGKRLMFVGDSLSLNQWQSMICMLQAVIPESKQTLVDESPITAFKAKDYDASVEFFWAAFLVDLDKVAADNENQTILMIDSVENNGKYWKGVDILVFETSHWWSHTPKPWDYIQEGNQRYEDMDRLVAYKKALTTWSKWIDSNIDPQKTRVFFRSTSPRHASARQWNGPRGSNCYSETEPITDESYLNPFPPQMEVLRRVLDHMKLDVSFLNITRLSDFRKDAHASLYAGQSPAEQKDPDKYADCTHWCIWGLPDIWNELLYVSLVSL